MYCMRILHHSGKEHHETGVFKSLSLSVYRLYVTFRDFKYMENKIKIIRKSTITCSTDAQYLNDNPPLHLSPTKIKNDFKKVSSVMIVSSFFNDVETDWQNRKIELK